MIYDFLDKIILIILAFLVNLILFSVMFGKGKGNKVDSRLEGVNIEEHDKKIEEETMRLVEILNEDDGQVPIKILLSVTLVFL